MTSHLESLSKILGWASASLSETRDVLSTCAASLQLAFDINLSTGWPTVAACCSVMVQEEGRRSFVNQEIETSTRVPASTQVYTCGGARLSQSEKNNRHFSRWQTHAVATAAATTAKKFPCPSVKRPIRVDSPSARNPWWYTRGPSRATGPTFTKKLGFRDETRCDMRGNV